MEGYKKQKSLNGGIGFKQAKESSGAQKRGQARIYDADKDADMKGSAGGLLEDKSVHSFLGGANHKSLSHGMKVVRPKSDGQYSGGKSMDESIGPSQMKKGKHKENGGY